MALFSPPTDRNSFKQYCLRRLGDGVNEVNVSEQQLDDRVNDALLFWWDYAFDGAEHAYYQYQLTSTDFTNKYITLPENIIGAVNIFPIGTAFNTSNMFNIRYQIALNDLYTLTSFSVVPYFMAIEHLSLLEQILVGLQPVRYNRYDNQLYLDMSWETYNVGDTVVVDCYQIVDPDILTNAWQDRLLARYATALIKQQWGTNLKLYKNIPLLGGVMLDGQTIYDEATAEIAQIEENVIKNFSMPPLDSIN